LLAFFFELNQILCNFGIFCTIILAKVLQSIFFGQLRLAEIERVNDRLWFTISETLLALAMFRDEFDTSFVVLFISLIFVKCFHWLAAYRVEWVNNFNPSNESIPVSPDT
jgi:E3 ubiquitin-protein ligase synoviolin